MFLNFFEFQLVILKDIYLTLLSIIFLITFFTGLSVNILKDFRFIFYFCLILFNSLFCKSNYRRYKNLIKSNNDFFYENKRYLIINDLLFLSYICINFYYFNLIHFYIVLLITIAILKNCFIKNKPQNLEEHQNIELQEIQQQDIEQESVIEYHINRNGRKVMRYEGEDAI